MSENNSPNTEEKSNATNVTESLEMVDSFNRIIKSMDKHFKDNSFYPDYFLATTFGLNVETLNTVLKDLRISKISNDNMQCDIYYDWHDIKELKKTFIGYDCFHSIQMDDGKAFHPKLILVRYKNADKYRYGAVISSRNLTNSSLIDGYAAMVTGDIEGTDTQNGNELYKYLMDKSGPFKSDRQELELLQKARFSLLGGPENAAVEFADAAELGKKIRDVIAQNQELIVCSPFVSYSTRKNNNITILTSPQSIANAKAITDNVYCYCTLDEYKTKSDPSWHAKIYCYTEGEKTIIAIGSSNFTNNGLGGNCELNCILTLPGEKSYNNIKKQIIDLGGDVDVNDTVPVSADSNTPFALPSEFYACLSDKEHCTITQNDNKWIVKITVTDEEYSITSNEEEKNFYVVKLSDQDHSKEAAISFEALPVSLEFVFSNDSREQRCSFAVSDISNLDDAYKDAYDALTSDNLTMHAEAVRNNIWSIRTERMSRISENNADGMTNGTKIKDQYIKKTPQWYEILKLKRAELSSKPDCDRTMLIMITETLNTFDKKSADGCQASDEYIFFNKLKNDIEKKLKKKDEQTIGSVAKKENS